MNYYYIYGKQLGCIPGTFLLSLIQQYILRINFSCSLLWRISYNSGQSVPLSCLLAAENK